MVKRLCRRAVIFVTICFLLPILVLPLQAQSPSPAGRPLKPAILGSGEAPIETADKPNALPPGVAALADSGPQIAAAMTEGFEGTWPATSWRLVDVSSEDGGDYLVGKRNCHPRSGSYGGWTVGGGAQGSALACDADYPNDANTWAIYGPFSLVGATSATLSFHLYGRSEHYSGDADCEYDFLYVGKSTDGVNFMGPSYCGAWLAGPDGNSYYLRSLDLSDHLGESQVWVAFNWSSDSTVAYNGITIDDVTLTTSSAPQGANTAYVPLASRPRSTESAVQLVTSDQEATISTPSGYQMTIPSGAVPRRQDGSAATVAFSIETNAPAPASLPGWVQRSDGIIKYGPDNFDFAWPISNQAPVPQVADFAQLSLLRYYPDSDRWLRMPMGFSDGNWQRVSAASYDLGYQTLAISPMTPDAQPSGPMEGAALTTDPSLTQTMFWYDGGFRIRDNRPIAHGLGHLSSRPLNFYLLLKSWTPKYAWQSGWGNIPDRTIWMTGTQPDSAPANETVWFMMQGTYEFCVSATEWYPPPVTGAKKFMYRDTITVVINAPSTNKCWITPCWTNLVEFPALDQDKWSETTPCIYNPGATVPVGTGEFQATLSWANTQSAATDLDLHLYGPNNIHIYYDAKTSADGSLRLDQDWQRALGHAVENIYSQATMPSGSYTLKVRHYVGAPKHFTVRTIHGAVAKTYSGSLESAGQEVTIETFIK